MKIITSGSRQPKHSRARTTNVVWRPPPMGKLICNVDAAFLDARKLGAVAAVIRDSGALVIGRSHNSSRLLLWLKL